MVASMQCTGISRRDLLHESVLLYASVRESGLTRFIGLRVHTVSTSYLKLDDLSANVEEGASVRTACTTGERAERAGVHICTALTGRSDA
jgi:hypothetical protein